MGPTSRPESSKLSLSLQSFKQCVNSQQIVSAGWPHDDAFFHSSTLCLHSIISFLIGHSRPRGAGSQSGHEGATKKSLGLYICITPGFGSSSSALGDLKCQFDSSSFSVSDRFFRASMKGFSTLLFEFVPSA
jgi:hypothetical protein